MFRRYGWLLSWFHLFHEVRLVLTPIVIVLVIQNAQAGNIDEIIVTEDSGVYHITVSAEIASTEKYIRQVLTDYAHAYRINSLVIESEVLESPIKGNIRVKSTVLCCIPLFCKEAKRLDEVSVLASGDLQAVIIPEQSDFNSGKAVWKIIPQGETTYLVYLASIEPSFFIPPVIGTRVVIENLREQFIATFFRIEQVARIKEEREWSNDFVVANVANRKGSVPCNDMVNANLQ